ncbi:acetyl esterase/lipase [Actinocorallia herbida]|uniref:Acetyl esterase/lipase n=1 Tax=Actinocorallia herbida TaxID=58109 RepID=A0A3N1D159_9ACTN|nr:alpha/beta hydrolase [Actinocorallia herbida]ROO87259.1 acetyl esterase/lipase [Actinocorallia herbida]
MSETTPSRPPFDPELVPVIEAQRAVMPPLGADTLGALRDLIASGLPGMPETDLTAGGAVVVEELTVPGPEGAPEIALTVLRPARETGPLPGIYHVHGGGMVMGTRHVGLAGFVGYVAEGLAVAVSVEYRLAPEHPDPAPVEDCYAGLRWFAGNAAALGADPERLMILGGSAGGGLAAGTALLARDRGFPRLTHQVLICPMLDDRMTTPSSRMLDGEGVWDRDDNLFGWTALLGDRRGTEAVSCYAAPARAEDLSGLPRTYLDVGSVETFRDEAIDYALRLSQAGVNVDFHLWGGGYHGFEAASQSAIAQASAATRDEFLRRALET